MKSLHHYSIKMEKCIEIRGQSGLWVGKMIEKWKNVV